MADPVELHLYPCGTCFEIRRFIPDELKSPGFRPVGGIGKPNNDDIRHDSLSRLYTLFGTPRLPLLTPPWGKGNAIGRV